MFQTTVIGEDETGVLNSVVAVAGSSVVLSFERDAFVQVLFFSSSDVVFLCAGAVEHGEVFVCVRAGGRCARVSTRCVVRVFCSVLTPLYWCFWVFFKPL